jgi:hypothetical protein
VDQATHGVERAASYVVSFGGVCPPSIAWRNVAISSATGPSLSARLTPVRLPFAAPSTHSVTSDIWCSAQ